MSHLFGRMSMVYRQYILCNNRSLIQIVCHKMSRCADYFHPSLECLPVGTGAYKGWQERVMDIHNTIAVAVYKLRSKNTHIFCQDEIVRIILIDNLLQAFLMRSSIQALVTHVMKGNLKRPGQRVEFFMIADDRINFCG